jgi:hypothetical protein
VWAGLVVATVVSWAVVLGVAVIKVRFVGLDFMELRNAPVLLRAAFEGYCVALWCVLAGIYWWL